MERKVIQGITSSLNAFWMVILKREQYRRMNFSGLFSPLEF